MVSERKEYSKIYRENNKEKKRIYRENNKEKIKENLKAYRLKNKTEIKEYQKTYYQTNKAKINEYRKKYIKIHRKKPEVRQKRNEYKIQRKRIDHGYKLLENLRVRLISACNVYSKTGKMLLAKEYGVDYKEIIKHLKPFPKDLENYQIDHIIPLSLFDFNNLEHIKIAFSSTNHQWLTIKENSEKRNRLIMPH